MPTHAERKVVPFTPEQMFDLVADVGKYPLFLPWCVASRVRTRTERQLVADLTIGFGPFRESFTSRVTLQRPKQVTVAYEDGPFHYLNNEWSFTPRGTGTEVGFFVDFEFRSRILQAAIGVVFNEAVKRMVRAFLKRASDVYGPPPASGSQLHGLRTAPAGPVSPARAGESVFRHSDPSVRRHEGGDGTG
jgi:coenzyme Q-binding protein COQ10